MLFFAILVLCFNSAYATKPGEYVNPNGFPSGQHYNLNIHGKKAEFNCPEQQYYMEITYSHKMWLDIMISIAYTKSKFNTYSISKYFFCFLHFTNLPVK